MGVDAHAWNGIAQTLVGLEFSQARLRRFNSFEDALEGYLRESARNGAPAAPQVFFWPGP